MMVLCPKNPAVIWKYHTWNVKLGQTFSLVVKVLCLILEYWISALDMASKPRFVLMKPWVGRRWWFRLLSFCCSHKKLIECLAWLRSWLMEIGRVSQMGVLSMCLLVSVSQGNKQDLKMHDSVLWPAQLPVTASRPWELRPKMLCWDCKDYASPQWFQRHS